MLRFAGIIDFSAASAAVIHVQKELQLFLKVQVIG